MGKQDACIEVDVHSGLTPADGAVWKRARAEHSKGELERAIVRLVVDEDHLNVPVGLPGHAAERLFDELLMRVGRYYHGNKVFTRGEIVETVPGFQSLRVARENRSRSISMQIPAGAVHFCAHSAI